MGGVTWYRHPTSSKHVNTSAFFLYFGRFDDGRYTPLRLVARYAAGSWLFVHRAWAKADGVRVDVPQDGRKPLGWERDNGAGDIWEWSDAPVTSAADIAAVRTLATAKAVTVRYEGKQYYDDRKLSSQQLKAMQEVIAAYETARGAPWK